MRAGQGLTCHAVLRLVCLHAAGGPHAGSAESLSGPPHALPLQPPMLTSQPTSSHCEMLRDPCILMAACLLLPSPGRSRVLAGPL